MNIFLKLLRFCRDSFSPCIETFVTSLPNAFSFVRIWFLNRRGLEIARNCFIARNVYFLGKVRIGDGSSISNNCMLSGASAGIFIGRKVMIAPNCILVAFDHGFEDLRKAMMDQPLIEKAIEIEDDVWVGANCTITKGVRLGQGCIVGANSAVTKSVAPYSIVGGVPARLIRKRNQPNNISKSNAVK